MAAPVISFLLGSAGTTIGQLGQITAALGASENALESFGAAASAIDLVINGLSRSYGLFIGANEDLQQNLTRTGALLQANTRLFSQAGQPITDLKEGLRASKDQLKEVLKELQVDSQELVGVTSSDVNKIFGIVSRNIGDVIGQSQKIKDPIASLKELTISLTAAAGAQGLSADQVAQEARALLSGDINNADALIAQSLNLTKQQVQQAQAQGRYIDLIIEKLEPYKVANAEAANTITGLTSNVQDFFEVLGREAGEQAIEPLTDGIRTLYEYLKDNKDALESGLTDALGKAVELLSALVGAIGSVGSALQPVFATFFDLGTDFLGAQVEGLTAFANGVAIVADTIKKRLAPVIPILDKLTITNPIQIAQDFAANRADPFRQLVTGDSKTAAEDAREALRITEEQLAANEKLLNLSKVKGVLDPEQLEKGRVATLNTIKAQEDLIKNVKGVKLFSDDDRSRQASVIDGATQKIKDLRAEAKEAGIDLDAAVKFAAKALQDRGQLIEATTKDLEANSNQIQKLTKEGGDSATFDKLTAGYVKSITAAQELGAITREQSITSLEEIVSNEKVALDTRTSAHQALLKMFQERATAAKASIDVEAAAGKALVATGRISAEQGAIVAQRSTIAKLQIDAAANQDEFEAKRRIGASTGSVETKAGLIQQQLAEAEGQLQSANAKEAEVRVERALERSTTLLKQNFAERKTIIAANNDFQENASRDQTQVEAQENLKQIESVRNKYDQLKRLPIGATQAEQIERDKKILAARGEYIDLTRKAIELEIKYQDSLTDSQIAAARRALTAQQGLINERDSLDSIAVSRLKAEGQNNTNLTETQARRQAVNESIQAQIRFITELNNVEAKGSPETQLKLEQDRIAARTELNNKIAESIDLTAEEKDIITSNALAEIQRQGNIRGRELQLATTREEIALGEELLKRTLSQGDAQRLNTQRELNNNRLRLDDAEKTSKQLAKVLKPATFEEQERLEEQRAAAEQNRLDLINERGQLLQRFGEEELELNRSLRDLELERKNIQLQAFEQITRVGNSRIAQLEKESELQNALYKLTEAQSTFAVSQQNIQLNQLKESLKLKDLEKKATEENNQALLQETRRQQQALGAGTNGTAEQVGLKQLQEQRDLIELQVSAAEARMSFERQSLEFEQEKTRLALEQEKIAARRQIIETSLNLKKLENERFDVERDQSLTDTQRGQKLANIDQQTALSKISLTLDQESLDLLSKQSGDLSRLESLQEQTLSLTQKTQAAEQNAQFRSEFDASRLDIAGKGTFLNSISANIDQINPNGFTPQINTPQSPELLGAIQTLNAILANFGENKQTVINQYYPDVSRNRASDRLRGY